MQILATGFNRFGDLSYNPTELMMSEVRRYATAWADSEIVTEVLPTEFVAAGERIRALVSETGPDAIISFGVAPNSREFLLERFALNLDDTTVPDNAGWAPSGLPIVPSGPSAYSSTLPMEQIFASLKRATIPTAYSNHAGTYVCNHVFYLARHEIDSHRQEVPCGLVHVPLSLSDPGLRADYHPSIFNVVRGVCVCLEVVRGQLLTKRAFSH